MGTKASESQVYKSKVPAPAGLPVQMFSCGARGCKTGEILCGFSAVSEGGDTSQPPDAAIPCASETPSCLSGPWLGKQHLVTPATFPCCSQGYRALTLYVPSSAKLPSCAFAASSEQHCGIGVSRRAHPRFTNGGKGRSAEEGCCLALILGRGVAEPTAAPLPCTNSLTLKGNWGQTFRPAAPSATPALMGVCHASGIGWHGP